jgi:choice-of-anchor C domain-containing protein
MRRFSSRLMGHSLRSPLRRPLGRFERLEERRLLNGETAMIKDIAASRSDPGHFTGFNGSVYFTAHDEEHGRELWKTDGTDAGAILLKDVFPGSTSSIVGDQYSHQTISIRHGSLLAASTYSLIFAASDPVNGNELWRTDGTESGTVLIKDVNVGADSSFPTNLVDVNGMVFFAATSAYGRELWKTDGTNSGTLLVSDISPSSSDPIKLTNMNGVLFFSAVHPSHGRELWKSDGTPEGTVLVKDMYPGTSSSDPSSLTVVGNTLFFVATDPLGGRELWMTDGTESGTTRVADIRPGLGNAFAVDDLGWNFQPDLINVDGTLFMGADDGVHGLEVWKSDGTAVGTVLVKDVNPGSGGSMPRGASFASLNGQLYFAVHQFVDSGIWRSDGTAEGTVSVKAGLEPAFMVPMNGKLFFRGTVAGYGQELWTTDGTTSGTVLVKDIWAGPISGNPHKLKPLNGLLYFMASDGVHDFEPWRSDGFPVSIANPAGGPYRINEGSSLTLSANSPSDPHDGPFTYTWDINGDGIYGDATGLMPTLTWAQLTALGIVDNEIPNGNPRPQPVRLRVSDGTGEQSEASASLTILNVAPVISNLIRNGSFEHGRNAGGPAIGVGSTDIDAWEIISGTVDYINYWPAPDGQHSLDMVGVSPGTIRQRITTEPGKAYDVHFSLGANYTDNPLFPILRVSAAGTYGDFSLTEIAQPYPHWQEKSFHFTATEATTALVFQALNGGVGGSTLDNVRIHSTGPITAPVEPIPVNDAISASASFTDVGTADTHTGTWNWGDGTTSAGLVTETSGSGTVSGSHAYASAGVYTLQLTVTDDDGGFDNAMFQYVVISDPSAGYVTGGGWINSPAGAYTADESLAGRASFGFNSQYKKGATVPTGETEFQFQVADFNFHSSSYDWLVVAGEKAKFKGEGTVNGAGRYGFMLTATDGKTSGDVDRFRIKIWNKDAADAVVYDNQPAEDDDSYAGTALGGGQVIIHKGDAQSAATSSSTAKATSDTKQAAASNKQAKLRDKLFSALEQSPPASSKLIGSRNFAVNTPLSLKARGQIPSFPSRATAVDTLPGLLSESDANRNSDVLARDWWFAALGDDLGGVLVGRRPKIRVAAVQ